MDQSRSPAAARVVCVCSDSLLRTTRQLVLSLRYVTVSVPRAADLRLLAGEPFDAVILCHTLSAAEFALALDICLHQWPHAEIIVLSFTGNGAPFVADHVVRTGSGPEYLLNTVDHLLQSHHAPPHTSATAH